MAGIDLSPIGTLLGVGTATGCLFLAEKIKEYHAKRRAPDDDPDNSTGQAKVIAASFIERGLMEGLTQALTAATAEMRVLNEHMRTAAQERHDARVAREAIDEELRRRGLSPTSLNQVP